jgi:ATF/CREB family transcription factor
MMSAANGGAPPGQTITPGTLSAITGALSAQNASHHGPSPLSMSQSRNAPNASSYNSNGNNNSGSANGTGENYAALAASAANTAANGLFLLSQAHQELTKREEAQREAAAGQVGANGKRGTKRKSSDAPPPPAPAKTQPKRTRAQQAPVKSHKRSESISEDEEEDDMEDDDMEEPSGPPSKNGRTNAQKKPETEEEKRKNFLERNRQAALKCRQRKKAWLAQLQAKVEFLTGENERLTSALVSSREEIARLSALVGATGGIPPGGTPAGMPIPPLTGHAATAKGRGYGY